MTPDHAHARTPAAETEDSDWMVDVRRAMHPFLASLETDFCSMCGDPAAHKVGEEHDLPFHNLSNYLCCLHFKTAVGNCEGYPYEHFAGNAPEVDYAASWKAAQPPPPAAEAHPLDPFTRLLMVAEWLDAAALYQDRPGALDEHEENAAVLRDVHALLAAQPPPPASEAERVLVERVSRLRAYCEVLDEGQAPLLVAAELSTNEVRVFLDGERFHGRELHRMIDEKVEAAHQRLAERDRGRGL